jgi:hypothetical protein
VRGAVNIIEGNPGDGKSTYSLELLSKWDGVDLDAGFGGEQKAIVLA